MAVHAVAAAQHPPSWCCVWSFLNVSLLVSCTFCRANIIYRRHELKLWSESKFLCTHKIPVELARSPGSHRITTPAGKRRRQRRARRQKRGYAGLSYGRSPTYFSQMPDPLREKMDSLRLQTAANNTVKDACILLITETWFHQSIPNSAVEWAAYTTHSATTEQ